MNDKNIKHLTAEEAREQTTVKRYENIEKVIIESINEGEDCCFIPDLLCLEILILQRRGFEVEDVTKWYINLMNKKSIWYKISWKKK